jgi:hypothetical protein
MQAQAYLLVLIVGLITLFTVGKAFAVATAIVFGGATLVFSFAASKLDLRNVSNRRRKSCLFYATNSLITGINCG